MTTPTRLDTPCIEWDGRRDRDQYGVASKTTGHRRAHRAAWAAANGPIPEGMCVLHRCDNPPCVNPDHLWLGTQADNNKDKARKGRAYRPGPDSWQHGRTHCPRGHPYEGENLLVYRNKIGWHRGCRECGRINALASYHRKQAAVRMARSLGIAAFVAIAAFAYGAVLGHLAPASAQQIKACGGQNAAPQPVPYTCFLPPKVIDGSTFSAVVHADGTSVSVLIHLAAPRTVDTPVRIVHHEGISGAGGTEDTAQGVLLAGQVNITLVDSAPCRVGQLDTKAVFIGNGQAQGRIGGPFISNGTGCIDTQTTVPATTIPVVTTVPVVPPTAGLIPPINEESTTSVAPTVAAKVALPATGDDWTQAQVGIAMLAGLAGIALIVAARKRTAQ